jgi:hypothetical protein
MLPRKPKDSRFRCRSWRWLGAFAAATWLTAACSETATEPRMLGENAPSFSTQEAERPAPVANLAVSATTATTATLTWTEVDDGTGEPASYDIRYALSPIRWGWGSATRLKDGDCARPLAGVEIGTVMTCIIPGLDPETTYDFQLVPFRGTLDVDAVYSETLSNVATGRTLELPSRPGRVIDLAVRKVSGSSVTLAFTEVDDGTGRPARYDIRYARAPIGVGWGRATVVGEGDCATPVAGAAIGVTRTCEVKGLEAEATYDFQMVAFRGTLNRDAVFGQLSTVATGKT